MNTQLTTSLPDAESNAADARLQMTGVDYDRAVDQFYVPLFRFAIGLSGNGSDAADLTQETFHTLLRKGDQVRDAQKLKSWLFTTLYRQFLGRRRHVKRFPEFNLEDSESELPTVAAGPWDEADGNTVIAALQLLDESYRAPLVMFYLKDMAYKEIAEVLAIPIGTVMSRLSRGKAQLRQCLQPALPRPLCTASAIAVPRPVLGQLAARRTSMFADDAVTNLAAA